MNDNFTELTCSDSSYVPDQVQADLPPYTMAMSQIPTLRAHLL